MRASDVRDYLTKPIDDEQCLAAFDAGRRGLSRTMRRAGRPGTSHP